MTSLVRLGRGLRKLAGAEHRIAVDPMSGNTWSGWKKSGKQKVKGKKVKLQKQLEDK